MTTQLDFDAQDALPTPSGKERAPRGAWAFPFHHLVGSAPVWVPMLLCAQLLYFGLRPNQREAERLDRVEDDVRARMHALMLEEEGLLLEDEMLSDPVYRERVRRSLLDPESPTLTLARARRLAGW